MTKDFETGTASVEAAIAALVEMTGSKRACERLQNSWLRL
jgi:hypothetical protein